MDNIKIKKDKRVVNYVHLVNIILFKNLLMKHPVYHVSKVISLEKEQKYVINVQKENISLIKDNNNVIFALLEHIKTKLDKVIVKNVHPENIASLLNLHLTMFVYHVKKDTFLMTEQFLAQNAQKVIFKTKIAKDSVLFVQLGPTKTKKDQLNVFYVMLENIVQMKDKLMKAHATSVKKDIFLIKEQLFVISVQRAHIKTIKVKSYVKHVLQGLIKIKKDKFNVYLAVLGNSIINLEQIMRINAKFASLGHFHQLEQKIVLNVTWDIIKIYLNKIVALNAKPEPIKIFLVQFNARNVRPEHLILKRDRQGQLLA